MRSRELWIILGLFVAGHTGAETLATVNGVKISSEMVQEALKSQPDLAKQPDAQNKALDKLISGELLVQEARKEKLDRTAEVKKQIHEATRQIMGNAAINHYLATHPVTEDEIKSRYETWVKDQGLEYHTRHILVMDEDDARAIRARIKNADDFTEEARQHSIDKMNAGKGGDLGWLAAAKLVKPYVDAVSKLKKDEISEPVKTFYGWHIIQLLDTRKGKVPDLKESRQLMIQQLADERIAQYVAELRDRTKITRP